MLADFETRILAQIDDRVEHGSDDELFAGGYLRGHDPCCGGVRRRK